MVRGRFLGVALLVAAPLAAAAADPLDAKVRNLSHPRYAEREKAARELEAAGEPALKALREAAKSNDEELRARAVAVADRIERALRSERLLAAPKLALKFDNVPLDRAVTEFAAKTQIRCVLDKSKIKEPDRKVTLDTGEVPYWEAVQAFYRAAGLAEDDTPVTMRRIESAGSGRINRRLPSSNTVGMLRLTDGPSAGPVDVGRALRVRALPAGFAQNKYDDIKGEVTFHLDVDPAPGLAVREMIGIEVRKAVAADGRSLAPAYPAPDALVGLGYQEVVLRQLLIANGDVMAGAGMADIPQPVTLKSGGLRPKALAELQGVVVARVVTPPEVLVTVTDLLRPGPREAMADGMTVQVKDVSKGTGNRVVVQARVTIRNDAADDIINVPLQLKGRVRPFIRINRGPGMPGGQLADLKIRDAAGVPIRGLSAQVTGMSFDGTGMVQDVQLSFEQPATTGDDGLTLVLMGRRAALVEMPFVLKDVPLP